MADAIRHFTENGAVAQLGERELCKLEVIGSIPFSSTSLRLAKAVRRSPQGEDGHVMTRRAMLEEAGREGTGFVLSLLSSDEAEIDIVKEDLCGHVMPHAEGRVPPVCPGYWAGRLDDGFGWDVMASGRYSWQERSWFGMRILDVIGPCESALV